jgi:uncharacterized protein with FMN-binding domain
MKRLVLLALLALGIAAVASASRFSPGTQTASARGYLGDINVSVVFDATRMVSITVTGHNETPAFANMVFSAMIPQMISAQTYNVDVIGGATATAVALRSAVQQAMRQASN